MDVDLTRVDDLPRVGVLGDVLLPHVIDVGQGLVELVHVALERAGLDEGQVPLVFQVVGPDLELLGGRVRLLEVVGCKLELRRQPRLLVLNLLQLGVERRFGRQRLVEVGLVLDQLLLQLGDASRLVLDRHARPRAVGPVRILEVGVARNRDAQRSLDRVDAFQSIGDVGVDVRGVVLDLLGAAVELVDPVLELLVLLGPCCLELPCDVDVGVEQLLLSAEVFRLLTERLRLLLLLLDLSADLIRLRRGSLPDPHRRHLDLLRLRSRSCRPRRWREWSKGEPAWPRRRR